jgi:hypothetical protein
MRGLQFTENSAYYLKRDSSYPLKEAIYAIVGPERIKIAEV